MRSVYVETTVVSYLTAKPSRDLVVAAHQQVTGEWWEKAQGRFGLYETHREWRRDSGRSGDELGKGNQDAADLHAGGIGGRLMVNDPIVEEVRKAIEAACDNDPAKYAERLRQVELKYADRLVQRGPEPTLQVPAVAEGNVPYGKPLDKSAAKG